ncbi:hypothetical protein [Bradyrhizobium sp. BR 10261]|nr:hypothetical protein [Bradyrhizobium sp. BR 10261]
MWFWFLLGLLELALEAVLVWMPRIIVAAVALALLLLLLAPVA